MLYCFQYHIFMGNSNGIPLILPASVLLKHQTQQIHFHFCYSLDQAGCPLENIKSDMHVFMGRSGNAHSYSVSGMNWYFFVAGLLHRKWAEQCRRVTWPIFRGNFQSANWNYSDGAMCYRLVQLRSAYSIIEPFCSRYTTRCHSVTTKNSVQICPHNR